MKLGKDESRPPVKLIKVELEIEQKLAEQLQMMHDFTKIPKWELLGTALKRFISQHKDYFPEGGGE
jgi:hypothetical protein